MDLLALLAAANGHIAAGRAGDAISLYRTWIARFPDHPALFVANFNFGDALNAAGLYEEAAACFQQAIAQNPDFIPPRINLGYLLERAGDRLGAVAQWTAVVDRLPQLNRGNLDYKLIAQKQLGRVLGDADIDDLAESHLQQSLLLDAHQSDVLQNWFNLRQRQCRWPLFESLPDRLRPVVMAEISPLSVASVSDNPLWQLAHAADYTVKEIGDPGEPLPERRAAENEDRPLRIGYLSSDLCDHAVGFLTTEIYGLHNRSDFEIFAYFSGSAQGGTTQTRIKAGVDHWREIRSLGNRDAAQLIADDKIDILVDLNGHTKDARTAILALDPAPIIVNWLGFPGSMGSNFHHYIIADPFLIPPGSERFYSEKVLHLPCYQPTDRQRAVSERAPDRAEAGLPLDAFVFCSFNETRKLGDETWRRWMDILQAVPDSVLWLFVPAISSHAHLRALAEQHGVAASRLVFAGRKSNPDHLARYVLADLILDSFPYGAHTTASDALWMGVPVLTLAGRSFPSRVCGSLLRAMGLPEMVCQTEADYIAKAVALASDPARHSALKQRLRRERDGALLFDTPLLVRSLEGLYRQMWDEYRRGELPRPDLSNMALYKEIGIELASAGALPDDLDAAYEAALRRRRFSRFWRPDGRLSGPRG